MAFNRRAKLRDNIEAIKTLFEIEKANRKATPDERAVLERYCGFGGLKCILNPAKSLADISVWSKSDMELFPMVAELHGVIRTNCTTDQEYKLYVNSLKNSILTAFYTPTEVVTALADALRNSGVTPNRFLDPSAGQGAFVSAFQSSSAAMDVMSFEKDLLTGKILTALYPDNKVRVEGFERIDSHYNNYFDVVSSNIPFGDVAVFDSAMMASDDYAHRISTKAIHNYFFAKGLDTVREGGVLAFITSQGVMNSPQNEPIRQMLMENTNLVSAIRLPNNLFVDSANTEVGSDLIILQKHTAKQELSPLDRAFIETRPMDNGIMTNSYFGDLSRVVHTKSSVDTDPYGKPAMVYKHEGGVSAMAEDMAKMLKADFVERLNLNLYKGIDNPHKAASVSEPVISTSVEPTLNFDAEPETPAVVSPQVEVTPVVKPQAPLVTLYDLFGMAVEERSQTRNRKASNRPKPTINQPRSLFDQPATAVQSEPKTPPPAPLSMEPREWKTP